MVWIRCLIFASVLIYSGCSTAPKPNLDPRDPEVWRPASQAVYPEPR